MARSRDDQIQSIAAVVVPLPMQSHLNQLLHLSAAISAAGVPVHYVGSAIHNRQAKLRTTAAAGLKPNIHFHDFPTPPLPPPSHQTTTNSSLRFPMHLIPAFMAYRDFRRPVAALVRQLSTTAARVVIVFDIFVSEAAADAALLPNVECYAFHGCSAFSLFNIKWQAAGNPPEMAGEYGGFLSSFDFPIKEMFIPHTIHRLTSEPPVMRERAGDIHNTTRLIEGEYVALLEREDISRGKKQWAIRPNINKSSPTTNSKIARHQCLEWLDRRAPRSVVYVSFGTSISLSDEEARELATGLELSRRNFIWVVRGADRADVFSGEAGGSIGLPEGFEERVRERGIVVRDWAPQAEILAHKSTAAFMSHCGWNSCLESLAAGVPMAAWPMHSDQPLNAVLVTEVLKVGILVREWTNKEEVVAAAVVKNAVDRLMAAEEGGQVRKRVEELAAAMSRSMEKGGVCMKELENFIDHITR